MSAPLTSETILAQLRGVKYPGYSRDIVSFGLVKDIKIDGTRVTVHIAVTTADISVPKQIEENAVAVCSMSFGTLASAVVTAMCAMTWVPSMRTSLTNPKETMSRE